MSESVVFVWGWFSFSREVSFSLLDVASCSVCRLSLNLPVFIGTPHLRFPLYVWSLECGPLSSCSCRRGVVGHSFTLPSVLLACLDLLGIFNLLLIIIFLCKHLDVFFLLSGKPFTSLFSSKLKLSQSDQRFNFCC